MFFQDEFRIHLWFCLIHLVFIIQQNQTCHVAMFSSKTVFPGHPTWRMFHFEQAFLVIPSLIYIKSLICKKNKKISANKNFQRNLSPKNNPNIFKTNISKNPKWKNLRFPLHRSHPPWAHWRTWSTQPIARPVLGANGDQPVDLIGPCPPCRPCRPDQVQGCQGCLMIRGCNTA